VKNKSDLHFTGTRLRCFQQKNSHKNDFKVSLYDECNLQCAYIGFLSATLYITRKCGNCHALQLEAVRRRAIHSPP